MPRVARAAIAGGVLLIALNLLVLFVVLPLLRSSPGLSVASVSLLAEGETEGGAIAIAFTKPVVTEDEVGRMPADEGPVALEPPTRGRFRWRDPRTLLFVPEHPLPGGRTLEIRIRDGFLAADRSPIEGPRTFAVSTPPARIVDVRHAGLRPDGRPILGFEFTAPVAPEALANNLSLTAAEERAPGDRTGRRNQPLPFQVLGAGARPSLHVIVNRPYRGKVYVRIDDDLLPEGGSIPIAGRLEHSVEILSQLVLLSAQGRADTEAEGRIVLRFNAIVPGAGQERLFAVDPPVPFRIEDEDEGVVLAGAFEPAKRYEVRCLQGLRGGGNLELQETAVRRVRIPELQPAIRILGRGVYWPGQPEISIAVETVNARRFVLRADAIHPNNIVWFDLHPDEGLCGNAGRRLVERTFEASGDARGLVRTQIDLRALLGHELWGVIAIQAEIPDTWHEAVRILRISDMALTAKRAPEEIAVWATRFAGPDPVEGADIEILSRSNQTLGRGRTGPDGIARVAIPSGPDPRADPSPRRPRWRRRFGSFGCETDPAERERPFVVLARFGGDLCALNLEGSAVPMADLPVSGRPYLRGRCDTFLYLDRDLYRPGETVRLRALVRDANLAPPPPFAVRLAVRRPDGRLWQRLETTLSEFGGGEVSFEIPPYMPTGEYAAWAEGPGGGRLGSERSFLVEEFLPGTMALRAALDRPRARPGDAVSLELRGTHNFGRPAAGRNEGATLRIREAGFQAEAFPGYSFSPASGRGREEIERTIELERIVLDAEGRGRIEARLPDDIVPSSALKAEFTATMWDAGGRSTSARASLAVDVHPVYAGILAANDPGLAGDPVAFRVAAVLPDGSPSQARRLTLRLLRRFWRSAWILDPQSGWRMRSEMEEEEIERREVELRDGRGLATFVPSRPGAYVAQVRAPEGEHIAEAVFDVDATRDWSPDSFPSPARARVTLDRRRYRPGDTAHARIAAPFGGLALVSVEGDRIHDLFVRRLPDGTGEFEIPIRSAYGPNVYVTASVVRTYPGAIAESRFPRIEEPEPIAPAADRAIAAVRLPYSILPAGGVGLASPREAEFQAVPASDRGGGSAASEAQPHAAREGRGSEAMGDPPIPIELLPFRALGAVPILIDPSDRTLQVRVCVPEKVRPGDPVEAQIFVAGPDGRPVESEVSLALVDEGILALTGMETPDPIRHAFAKRRLETSLADVYARIVPPVRGATPAGGDGDEEEAARRRLTQPIDVRRVRPVALWISPIRTSAEGLAFARFEAPELDSRLRAMAVAASREGLGSAETGVVVRRPLVAKPTFPRFLACGDRFEIPVSILNDTGAAGEVRVAISAEGAARIVGEAVRAAAISGDGEALVGFQAEAAPLPGRAAFSLEVSLGAAQVHKTVEIPVRPALPSMRRSGAGIVRPGETIPIDPGFVPLPGTGGIEIRIAGSPLAELSPAIAGLRGYPYGCAEQTASQLVALTAIADPILSSEDELAEILPAIAGGIDRLLSMQTSAGGLSLWPDGRRPSPWASVYAADVLWQARRAGHPVDDQAFDDLIGYVNDLILDRDAYIATRAYAAYVTVLAGKGDIAEVERLSEEDLPDAARFFVAMALRRAGEIEAARRLIQGAGFRAAASEEGRAPNPETLGSGIRDDAIVLLALLEIEPESEAIPRLVERIRAAAANDGCWRTTQENAFAILSLSAYARRMGFGRGAFRARILSGGRPIGEATETRPLRRTLALAEGGDLAIACEGSPAYWAFVAQGVPAAGEAEAFDRGIAVRRRILDWRGEPVAGALAQGESYIVEISLSSPRWLEHVAVEDLLPAGLEIENPRFETTDAEIPEALRRDLLRPESVEMRDDRLLLFTSYAPPRKSHPFRWRYVVRAVTAGTFALPPIRASCMYEGGIESASGAGSIAIRG